jgi:hypothetical protein
MVRFSLNMKLTQWFKFNFADNFIFSGENAIFWDVEHVFLIGNKPMPTR